MANDDDDGCGGGGGQVEWSRSALVWYYGVSGGARGGPVSWLELAKLADDDMLIWTAGMQQWTPFAHVDMQRKQRDDDDAAAAAGAAAADAGDGAGSAGDKKKRVRTRKKRKAKPAPNASVYVTKLPEDVSVDEIVEHFNKMGIIKTDLDTDEHKVKIYRDERGVCKGDALVTYMQPLSADQAVAVLDGSQIRPGVVIKVEKAQFQNLPHAEKDAQDKKPKLSASQLAVQRRRRNQKMHELLSWDDEQATSGLRIVILKHMFSPSEAEEDPLFYKDLETEIGLECQRIGGPIEKLTVFQRSPIGAVAVKFAESAGADKCIEVMNGRFFAGRRIECDYFDGVTNYKVKESEAEEAARIKEFGDWLEDS